ncbi:MAG TPA: Lrp/AsnC ligand binding domain-containing protein [Burkholderiales bacterium]|nr:Lrp/AsnC ligand binding domain-containing protein [Burkholderiales bacterium]
MKFGALDRIDRQLLRLLQKDGRMSNVDLAARVHLSPAACLERVRALSGAGFIRGFHARLDPASVEAGMLVFVQVVLDRTTPDVFDAFRSAVHARPEILECHMIAGGFDYLLKARVKDMRAYREFTASAVWALPGVRETHTYVVMEEVKETAELPLT